MELNSRQIDQYIWDEEIIGKKMIFLSGPRQVGKTTYTKNLLKAGRSGAYFNWDNPLVRGKYREDPFFFLERLKGEEKYIVIFDEIHKRPKWKDILKGIYDTVDSSYRFLVTGSARLELFRKSGDSLVGRYMHFHLLPLSIPEIVGSPIESLWLCSEKEWDNPWERLLEKVKFQTAHSENREIFENLLMFGGFPEPLIKGSERFLLRWKREYLSLILTEDLRELTNIKEIDTVEKIIHLLPERVGSPLSLSSVSRDVESTYPTIKNHLYQLERLWLLFSISPWSVKINRTLKKEKKCYFTNWIYASDKAKIFENMIAAALLRACIIWTDLAYGVAKLWYIRNFDGKEIDFLITLNNKPALLVEAKLADDKIARHGRNVSARLNVPIIQVLEKPSLMRRDSTDELIISAEKLLSILP